MRFQRDFLNGVYFSDHFCYSFLNLFQLNHNDTQHIITSFIDDYIHDDHNNFYNPYIFTYSTYSFFQPPKKESGCHLTSPIPAIQTLPLKWGTSTSLVHRGDNRHEPRPFGPGGPVHGDRFGGKDVCFCFENIWDNSDIYIIYMYVILCIYHVYIYIHTYCKCGLYSYLGKVNILCIWNQYDIYWY